MGTALGVGFEAVFDRFFFCDLVLERLDFTISPTIIMIRQTTKTAAPM